MNSEQPSHADVKKIEDFLRNWKAQEQANEAIWVAQAERSFNMGRDRNKTITGWTMAYGAGLILFVLRGGNLAESMPGVLRALAFLAAWLAITVELIKAVVDAEVWRVCWRHCESTRINAIRNADKIQGEIHAWQLGQKMPEIGRRNMALSDKNIGKH